MPTTHPLKVFALVIAAASVSAPRTAAQSTASVHRVAPPVASAARRTADIHIDGRLDDPAWAAATPITQFTQTDPVEGTPATQRTEVRVLYDDQAIYVGARMYDSQGAAGVRTRLARRDQQMEQGNNNGNAGPSITSDQLQVSFDTYHDHRGHAEFHINPSGVKDDALDVGGSGADASWDPVWDGAARIDSLGWTAELRIPLSQLRYGGDSVQTWGMQIVRIVDRINEHDAWAFWRKNESGGPPRYGHLEGLRVPHASHETELLPYVVERSQYLTPVTDDPFHVGRGTSTRFGADVKYLVTSNLTLDATINPDFGQVEVDPAVVNLTAYETFFPEKRPFFVANSGAFDFGEFNCYFCTNSSNLNVFYSRRIGRAPQLGGYATDQAEFADVPDNATILGAAKVTGRTAGGTSVGVLDAVTNRQNALLQNATAPKWQQEVEPFTNYFVGRVKQDYRQGATTLGGILTSVVRRMDDTVVSDRLRNRATVGGVDLSHAWHARDYRLIGQFVVSDVAGSSDAMALTERSSTHYFQRPDRRVTSDGLFSARYDTTATELRGYGGYARLAKENGDWLWETGINARSPGFEVNDIAYLSQGDYVWQNANIVRQWTVPGRVFRNVAAGFGGQVQHNYDGDVIEAQQQIGMSGQLLNYWNVQAFAVRHPSTIDDRLTRGGPSVRAEGYMLYIAGVSTDSRGTAVFNVNATHVGGIDAPTDMWQWSPSVTLKPTSNVSVSLGPTFYSIRGGVQYVTDVVDPAATAFGGTRYVFADLTQHMVSLDTRLNVTFSPRLTLELFAQPFDASGAYSDFFEFARTRDRARAVYGRDGGTISATRDTAGAVTAYTVDPDGGGPAKSFTMDNPDFSVRSLRGNAVLRWEYRPGSTLFFVWTQQRFSSDASGELDFTHDRTALARAHPDNVFMVKATYWLGF